MVNLIHESSSPPVPQLLLLPTEKRECEQREREREREKSHESSPQHILSRILSKTFLDTSVNDKSHNSMLSHPLCKSVKVAS